MMIGTIWKSWVANWPKSVSRRVRLEESSVKLAEEVEKGLSFDLALIDMTMPEMDGMALAGTDQKPNSPSTECIMVTAINEARIAVECLNKGRL
jgi:CheY-like chemotaxis protein